MSGIEARILEAWVQPVDSEGPTWIGMGVGAFGLVIVESKRVVVAQSFCTPGSPVIPFFQYTTQLGRLLLLSCN